MIENEILCLFAKAEVSHLINACKVKWSSWLLPFSNHQRIALRGWILLTASNSTLFLQQKLFFFFFSIDSSKGINHLWRVLKWVFRVTFLFLCEFVFSCWEERIRIIQLLASKFSPPPIFSKDKIMCFVFCANRRRELIATCKWAREGSFNVTKFQQKRLLV